jgi:hypothetical protein
MSRFTEYCREQIEGALIDLDECIREIEIVDGEGEYAAENRARALTRLGEAHAYLDQIRSVLP